VQWRKTYEGAEPQRVNKWLASEGVCSRREAEELITKGVVSIDGARSKTSRSVMTGLPPPVSMSSRAKSLPSTVRRPW
jgi:16S rRNA U516 pseudouridylate synthase RsuA-like enzyme